jgi:hypothetical protein
MTHVNFAKFFVPNARVLESMIFHTVARFNNGKFLAGQHRKLELENKASRDDQFHFTTTVSLSACYLEHQATPRSRLK